MHHLHAYCSLNVLSRANIIGESAIGAKHHFHVALETFSLGEMGEVLNSTFFFKNLYLFIYFWLCWVFVATPAFL